MSQTLQNQITYAKSMNGIITLSDGMGTTIQNGQVITTDLCGNTVTANNANIGTLTLNDIDLNGSLTVEAINDIPYTRGNVSVWNKGNTLLQNAVSITGDLYTSGQNIFDGSYQAITVVNGNFMDPVLPSATSVQNILLAQTNTTPNFSAYTGWGFFSATAKSYNIRIQKGTGGTYYFTYFPSTANQALILQTNGVTLGSVSAQTQTYTLTSGIYTFSFYIQHNSWCVDSRIFAYVYTSTGSLITSLSNLNVSGQYPNWVQYKMNFTLTATTDIYFIIKETTINTATSEYVAVYGCTLQQTEISIFKDNNLISGIGGSSSLLNNLIVNNSASITGGATVAGGLTVGSTLGLNNTPINSKMNNANNSYNIAIGNGVLDNLTNGQRNTVVGDGACALNVATSSDLTVVGYGTYILNNESRSTFVGSYISSRSVNGMNTCVGYGIGGGIIGGATNGDLGQENAIVGYYNLIKYNGFGTYSPSQNSILGALSCYNLGDSYNSAVGYKTFYNMTNTAGTNTTRYNSAIGANAGDSYALYNYCTLIGANSDTGSSGLTNATAIGANTIVSSSNTIQLGSNNETVKMSGNIYVPRQNAILQSVLGDINIQSALTPIDYDGTYSLNIWDKTATGQIVVVDTSNNTVEINTNSMSIVAPTNMSIESANISLVSANAVVDGTLTVNGNCNLQAYLQGTAGFVDINFNSRFKILSGDKWNIGSSAAYKYLEFDTLTDDISLAGNNLTLTSTGTTTFNGTTSISFTTPDFTMTGNVLMNSYATTTQLHTFNNGITVNNTVGTFNNGIEVNGSPIIVNTSLKTDTLSSIAGLTGTTTMYGNIAFANGGGGIKSINNPAQNAMTFNTANSLQITGIGALYCSSSPRIKAGYLNNSIFVTTSQNIGSVYPAMICVAPASTATVVLTFNTLNASYDGMRLTIRRVSTANATAQVTSNVANIYNNSGVAGNAILASNQYVQTIMCGQLTAGTYAWFYV